MGYSPFYVKKTEKNCIERSFSVNNKKKPQSIPTAEKLIEAAPE